ncbi:MAG TPA: hypothetical protein VMS11_06545 [Solirubrobacterales bacterium]|nr:hypothetical protein [Solirubrobacterales bacterium]
MPKKRGTRGKSLDVRAAEWEPILNLAPDHVDDFMWMYAVELADGTRLQVYKHYWTRNVIHLDSEGRAFAYLDGGRYEEVEVDWVLPRVLSEDFHSKEAANFVGHNYAYDGVEIRWSRAATKHRISRERSRHVIEHCGLWLWRRPLRREPHWDDRDDRVMFFGDDIEGVALEVFAVEGAEEDLLVIHAMDLRDRHRGLYQEARQWRK